MATATKQALPLPQELKDFGYSALPRGVSKLFGEGKLGGAVQMVLVLAIGESTFGDQARPEWATGLTARKLAPLCGCSVDPRNGGTKHIEKSLSDLAERGMIERQRDGRGWKYRLSFWNWPKAKKYDRNLMEQAEVVSEDEPPAEDPAQPNIAVVPAGEPLIVLPGKRSKPFPLPKAEKAQFAWRNESSHDLKFLPGISDGVLILTAFDAEAKNVHRVAAALRGEETVNHRGAAVPLSKKPSQQNQGLTSSTAPKNELQSLLDSYSLQAIGKRVDAKILGEVAKKLNGTPLPMFQRLIEGAKKRLTSAALFPLLAKEASEAHESLMAYEANRRGCEDPAAFAASVANWRARWPDLHPEDRELLLRADPETFGDLAKGG